MHPTTLNRRSPLYAARPAGGVSRVVCYSPRHNLTLAELTC